MNNYKTPWMTEELRILFDSVKKFAEIELLPDTEKWREQGYVDREAWRKAGGMGILCASIPEIYGGLGGNFFHEAVINDALVKAGVQSGLGLDASVHSQIVAHYILSYGNEEQKMRWLPKMAAGEFIGAVAMTEPGTGSDLQGIKLSAVGEGDHYILNGQKTFISNGQLADIVVMAVKTDPLAKGTGLSLIVVETDGLKGFERGRNLKKIGLKDQDTSELFFNDCRVPATNLLGADVGQGFRQLKDQLVQERLGIACTAVSVMECAINETLKYVAERKAFGKPIAQFQNTQFKLAECATIATVAKTFVDQLIADHVAGQLDVTRVCMAKWWTTDMQVQIVDECLQLHGGYGYMQEYPIARMFVDSRVQRIYGGTNEIMKDMVARSLM